MKNGIWWLLGAIGLVAIASSGKSKKKSLNGTETKYYLVEYTKKVGGTNQVVVKGKNEKEALNHAKFGVHTGKNFRILKEVPPTKHTVKGPGKNRAN